MLYGKKWAYCIQVDDGGSWVAEYGAKIFSQCRFTDAPPGISGGKSFPVVGDVAIWTTKIGANPTYLNAAQIAELREEGWDLSNHSHTHRGRTFGDPPEPLSLEEMRAELFWSQALLATFLEGRPPAVFVYPNGYTAYQAAIKEAGFRAGVLVGGEGGKNLASPKLNLLLFSRNYLDEGFWTSKWAKGDPMAFLKEEPEGNDVMIDFTHEMDHDPQSANQQRWAERLRTISLKWGEKGEDSFWSAPTPAVFDYFLASKEAAVDLAPGNLTVRLSEGSPGSRLTVRLDNFPPETKLPTPEGSTIYRDGTTAWVTTPFLGQPRMAPPQPVVEKIWEGKVGEYVPDRSFRLAAVRLNHSGTPEPGELLHVEYEDEKEQVHVLEDRPLNHAYADGDYLVATVPNKDAPIVTRVNVTPLQVLKGMEVWAVKP